MMLVDDIMSALEELPDLAGRIQGGLELARLMKDATLPNGPRAAFVVSLGLDPKPSTRATGVHQQQVHETVGVLLVVSAPDDPKGAKARSTVEALVNAVVLHLTGRLLPAADDVLSFARGRRAEMGGGAAAYQLDFSTHRYLRKTT